MTETLYKLNATDSPNDIRDYQAENIFPFNLSIPNVFDPRKNLLGVRDQKSEGSCVAEATSCLKEIQEKKNINFEDYMSPQFVYNNRKNQTGEGMYPRDSMDILYKKGIVAEEDYLYGKIESPDKISQEVYDKAQNYKIKGYAFVNTINTMKAAIYRSGSCIIAVPVYNYELNLWKPLKQGDLVIGEHAMAAIGFNNDGFIIRNSWGPSWGDGGYTIFPYADWGFQSEVWTLIDDDSSKPDPKYSKWYWKTWRAIKNTFINLGSSSLFISATFLGSIGVGIFTNKLSFIASGLIAIGITIYSIIKKLYMVAH